MSSQKKEKKSPVPIRISSDYHTIQRDEISVSALKVIDRLNQAGYEAYLVGGGVRDMLLGKQPKDFDVVTAAHPAVVRKIFKNSRLIGRRFRLVHVYFSLEVIEVSTFRASVEREAREPQDQANVSNILLDDNTYGTMEEDVWRRDFTVNALYYDVQTGSIIDFTGGLKDLKKRVIRMIGEPIKRYYEDPVRLLRALRLSAKLDFNIEKSTKEPLMRLHALLDHVPKARLFSEFLKIFFKGHAFNSYQLFSKTKYMHVLFPQMMTAIFHADAGRDYEALIILALKAIDQRYREAQTLNPGFLLSVFLWPAVQEEMLSSKKQRPSEPLFSSLHTAISKSFEEQSKTLFIPHRLMKAMRLIWVLQYRLMQRRYVRIQWIANQPYFRAGVAFFYLRAQIDSTLLLLADWWCDFRDASPQKRASLHAALKKK